MNECTLCHQGTYRERLIVFSSRRGGRAVVVEDVPAWVCDACGDKVITDETARKIEQVTQGEAKETAPLYRLPSEAMMR